MLAMHYKIILTGGAEAVENVRRRAAERGPLFDGMAGLAEKYFLVDPAMPTYATFYLWHAPEAALAFLQGSFFAALSATFGRPEVRLLLPTTISPPRGEPASAVISEDDPDGRPSIATLDPLTGRSLNLVFSDVPGRRFEVMYHARGSRAVLDSREAE